MQASNSRACKPLTHPYPGENKLADRLLAIKDVKESYGKLLKELSSTCFTKERLLKEIEAVEKTTKEPLAREAKATAARKEGPPGFGPPGGKGPQAPDLRAFVEKRTASVTAQLDGKSKGFVPQFGFGPPGGGGGPQSARGRKVRWTPRRSRTWSRHRRSLRQLADFARLHAVAAMSK